MQHAAAAERNKQPILEVLQKYLPTKEKLFAVEVASGTGQHISYFAKFFPNITWQPSEYEPAYMASIKAHIEANKLVNVLEPKFTDATQPGQTWANATLKETSCDVVMCINMLHITPSPCTPGLIRGAGYLLKPGGFLITYGPYAINGIIEPQSNVDFDRQLRATDAELGLRDIDDLTKYANNMGLVLENTIEMPANNKTLIFRKK